MAPVPHTIRELAQSNLREIIILLGTTFAAMCYGFVVVLVIQANTRGITTFVRLCFLTLATVSLGLQISHAIAVLIDEKPSYPPQASDLDTRHQMSETFALVADVNSVLLAWSSDATSLWRFYIIFSHSNIKHRAFLVAAVFYFADIALGSLFLGSLSSASPLRQQTFTIPFRTISIFMRVAITVLILSRLIQHVHAVSSTFISTDRTVAKVARMLAEVAAVEAIVALIYIIMVGLSSHWQQIAFPVLEQTQAIGALVVFVVRPRKFRPGGEFSLPSTTLPSFEAPRRLPAESLITSTYEPSVTFPKRPTSALISSRISCDAFIHSQIKDSGFETTHVTQEQPRRDHLLFETAEPIVHMPPERPNLRLEVPAFRCSRTLPGFMLESPLSPSFDFSRSEFENSPALSTDGLLSSNSPRSSRR